MVKQSTDCTFSIISLGCSKNQVDAEKVKGGLLSAGFSLSERAEEADIIIINTCGFITPAKEESISTILDALDLRIPRERYVAVTGCLSERYFDDLLRDMPEIDFLYGLLDDAFVEKMAAALDIRLDGDVKNYQEPLVRGLSYACIKIAEGCSNNCSYCAIPLIRGGLRCVGPEEILEDARRAVNQGARELVIIAQDTAAYHYHGLTLPGLVRMIARDAAPDWIRILYCHPDHITDDIIAMFAENDKILPYIDLPFQHVNERILRSMGRGGSYNTYRDLVNRLRNEVPRIRIRSTFMTGYPGEGEEDFEEVLAFLREMRLDRVGAFVYSPEEDTPAATLDGAVPNRKAKKRYEKLMALQQGISEQRLQEMIGDTVRVIIEEQVDEETWIGRSEYDAPEVDGVFYLTGHGHAINSIVNAKVTDSSEYDLMGEVT